jgi:hypothetical protein
LLSTVLSITLRNWTDVDRVLDEWRTRLRTVDDNLRELDDEPTLRKLEGRPGLTAVPLEGDTAARVGPALRSLREVWAYRDLLAEVLERADELRKSVRPWSEARQMQAIDDLLNGPSITLLSATVPLALRSLAASAQEQHQLTPAALLHAMESSFADARDAVFAVDSAWDTLLPSFAQASRDLDALCVRARALALDMGVDTADLSNRLLALRQQVERDPLGASAGVISGLEPLLDFVRERVSAFEQTRASVGSDLARADALVAELCTTNAAVRDAQLRCQAEIRDALNVQAPLEQGRIEGLQAWLATLRDIAAQASWAAARVGLDRWLDVATEYLTTVRAARDANSAPLEQRDQLVGLLRARRAQSRDLAGRGLYLAPEADEDARQAIALASERPCRLSELLARVVRFDAAVSALAQAARQPPVRS